MITKGKATRLKAKSQPISIHRFAENFRPRNTPLRSHRIHIPMNIDRTRSGQKKTATSTPGISGSSRIADWGVQTSLPGPNSQQFGPVIRAAGCCPLRFSMSVRFKELVLLVALCINIGHEVEDFFLSQLVEQPLRHNRHR